MIDPEQMHILLIGLVTSFLIIAHGTYLCRNPDFHSTLHDPILGTMIDGWEITHFVLYAVLTYIWPRQALFIFVMGVIWETLECVFRHHPVFLMKCKDPNIRDTFWYERWSDILVNALGVTAGYFLARYATLEFN